MNSISLVARSALRKVAHATCKKDAKVTIGGTKLHLIPFNCTGRFYVTSRSSKERKERKHFVFEDADTKEFDLKRSRAEHLNAINRAKHQSFNIEDYVGSGSLTRLGEDKQDPLPNPTTSSNHETNIPSPKQSNDEPMDSAVSENLTGRWIADTGSGIHLIGESAINTDAKESSYKGNTIALSTAGGHTASNKYVDVRVSALDQVADPLVMKSSPPVL